MFINKALCSILDFWCCVLCSVGCIEKLPSTSGGIDEVGEGKEGQGRAGQGRTW